MELAAATVAAWSGGGARSVQGDKHSDRLAQTVCECCKEPCGQTSCYKLTRATKGADRMYFRCAGCKNLKHRISRVLRRADEVLSVAWAAVHQTKRIALYKDAKDMYGDDLEARIAATIEDDLEMIMAKLLTGITEGLSVKMNRLWRWLEVEQLLVENSSGEGPISPLSPEKAADLLFTRVNMRDRFIENSRSRRRPSRSQTRKRHGA